MSGGELIVRVQTVLQQVTTLRTELQRQGGVWGAQIGPIVGGAITSAAELERALQQLLEIPDAFDQHPQASGPVEVPRAAPSDVPQPVAPEIQARLVTAWKMLFASASSSDRLTPSQLTLAARGIPPDQVEKWLTDSEAKSAAITKRATLITEREELQRNAEAARLKQTAANDKVTKCQAELDGAKYLTGGPTKRLGAAQLEAAAAKEEYDAAHRLVIANHDDADALAKVIGETYLDHDDVKGWALRRESFEARWQLRNNFLAHRDVVVEAIESGTTAKIRTAAERTGFIADAVTGSPTHDLAQLSRLALQICAAGQDSMEDVFAAMEKTWPALLRRHETSPRIATDFATLFCSEKLPNLKTGVPEEVSAFDHAPSTFVDASIRTLADCSRQANRVVGAGVVDEIVKRNTSKLAPEQVPLNFPCHYPELVDLPVTDPRHAAVLSTPHVRDALKRIVEEGHSLDFGGGITQAVGLLDAVDPHVEDGKTRDWILKHYGPLVSTQPSVLRQNLAATEKPSEHTLRGTTVFVDELLEPGTDRLDPKKTKSVLAKLNFRERGQVHLYTERPNAGELRQQLQQIANEGRLSQMGEPPTIELTQASTYQAMKCDHHVGTHPRLHGIYGFNTRTVEQFLSDRF